MAKKPLLRDDLLEVVYDEERWRILRRLRRKAVKIMEALNRAYIGSVAHGSIARGDVSPKSDVDIFIPQKVPSFLVETALERAGIPIKRRVLIQATPTYAIKAYIEVDERTSVSFPLVNLRPVERDFYKFGGEVDLPMLKAGVRVPGVDKRLMLIEPTPRGHVESTIIGREETVARLLGISVNTVLDRVRTLTRRDEIGRTGVFLKKEIALDESLEEVLKNLADRNPAIRRRLREG
ncbi:DNA polymerase subunit beta [Candidatus Bathyarchaeota archaeon]|nr:MAG: DNA polymerase subunit beta [Candidatus Bathyarchaeota archaeon]